RAAQKVRRLADERALVALAASTLRVPDHPTGAPEPAQHCTRHEVRRTRRQRQILLTHAVETREPVERFGDTTLARRAAVGRAGVAVVAHERCARLARAGLAGFIAVAGIRVGARRAVRRQGMLAAELAVAAVGGAGIAVVAGIGREDAAVRRIAEVLRAG